MDKLDALTEQVAKETYDNLSKMTRIDNLTGLHNRNYLDRNLIPELQRTDEPFSVFFIDADNFKLLNDKFGHRTGDTALRILGIQVRTHSRLEDVGIRYGGEEVVLLIRGVVPDETLRERAEQIRQAVANASIRREDDPSKNTNMTVSIGIAIRQGTEDPMDVIARADGALYLAKRSGRNTIRTEGDLIKK